MSLAAEAAAVGDSALLGDLRHPYSPTVLGGRPTLTQLHQGDSCASNLSTNSRNSSVAGSSSLPYPALTLGAASSSSGSMAGGSQHLRGRSPPGRSPTAGRSPPGSHSAFAGSLRGHSPGGGSRGASPRGGSRGASPGGSPHAQVTYVGPNAAVQPYCTQEITAELNAAAVSLLTAVKSLQDKAIAKNPGKVRGPIAAGLVSEAL